MDDVHKLPMDDVHEGLPHNNLVIDLHQMLLQMPLFLFIVYNHSWRQFLNVPKPLKTEYKFH